MQELLLLLLLVLVLLLEEAKVEACFGAVLFCVSSICSSLLLDLLDFQSYKKKTLANVQGGPRRPKTRDKIHTRKISLSLSVTVASD